MVVPADRVRSGVGAGGELRPQPTEDLPAGDKAGAESEAKAGVHIGPEGGLRSQVHPTGASSKATSNRVVPR